MSSETFDSLLVILAWVITTGIPAGIAVIKHLREKAYKEATSDLMDAIEKFDEGPVKEAVSKLVSKRIHAKVITPYLKENGYEKNHAHNISEPDNIAE